MILEQKQTHVAYHCPHCGMAVLGYVGEFALAADIIVRLWLIKHSEVKRMALFVFRSGISVVNDREKQYRMLYMNLLKAESRKMKNVLCCAGHFFVWNF